MELANKIAVLTGASSGLGSGIAKALVKENVTVYGLARNKNKLENIQQELGKQFIPVSIDITDQPKISAWIEQTFSAAHAPDILINNAGVGGFQPIDEISAERWLQMMNTNLNGVFYLTAGLVPFLKKKKNHTHIINIGSILGTMTRTDATAYCATKYGINGFSDALFRELRGFDIKVTVMNPGSINTDFFKSSDIHKHSNMLQPEDVANTLIHVLKTPDNMLINELTLRPLNPRKPK